MASIMSPSEALHTKFYGDPHYRRYGDNPRTWKAVELLSTFLEDEKAYVEAQPNGRDGLNLLAITPSHLYSVQTDEPPAIVIDALHLTRLVIRGDLNNKSRPTIQVALHLPNDGGDPVVLAPEASYNDRRQLDELLDLLPVLRDAVR